MTSSIFSVVSEPPGIEDKGEKVLVVQPMIFEAKNGRFRDGGGGGGQKRDVIRGWARQWGEGAV